MGELEEVFLYSDGNSAQFFASIAQNGCTAFLDDKFEIIKPIWI